MLLDMEPAEFLPAEKENSREMECNGVPIKKTERLSD